MSRPRHLDSGRKRVSHLKWLMNHLPLDARISLEIEIAWFKYEPTVMEYLNRVELHEIEYTHEVLREAFPFNLSLFGHDYWAAIAEALPKAD